MIDKDFCLSSYMAYRYIFRDNVDFFIGLHHINVPAREQESLIQVSNADEIDNSFRSIINDMYEKYMNPAVLLSGGMDSAIVASYLKPGTFAYTFTSTDSDVFSLDVERAKKYCDKLGFHHHLVSIDFDDYKELMPRLFLRKHAPTHSIEPQILKAAIQAKKDGADILLIGDSSDYIFGGMDKLLSEEWTYKDFVKRYYTLDPNAVLTHPVDVSDLIKPYVLDGKVDVHKFLSGPAFVESIGSYDNAIKEAGLPYLDPYESLTMMSPIDLNRIRNGESKYLIRELYKKRYPEYEIPEKIPMPRPVDYIFKDWAGPTRPEFRDDICMDELSGNQKWQLWCAEEFLNYFDR